ncbi:MAG: LiaF transmembrane domain-containing protein [Candidatus Cryptobacteroides sp.]
MKRTFKIALGLAFVAAGIIWILNLSGILDFSFSLDGWWAFFVIVPCLFGLIEGPDRIGSCVGICIGVLLLLSARGIIAWGQFWQFALAVLVIGIGVKMIFFKDWCSCKVNEVKSVARNGKDVRSVDFSFGKQVISYDGEKFEGLDVKVAFGAAEIDLRRAVIEEDVEIRVEVAFGGVLVLVPDDITVKPAVNCSFAGMADNRRCKGGNGTPAIYVSGKAAFGGVELK